MDIGAYFVGRSLGRHPLFPKISPKKTIEGFVGGSAAAFIVSLLIALIFNFFSLIDALWFAAIVSIMGTVGDLTESMFKRNIDVKDSGSIMPGHGGLLDRFDSAIMIIPFIVLYLYLK